MFIPSLVLLCFVHDGERERLEYQPSPTQPRLSSATGALVTWNSCVRLLCPALRFPSRNRTGVSLPVPGSAPPSSRSHSGGDNEDKGGVSCLSLQKTVSQSTPAALCHLKSLIPKRKRGMSL